MNLEDRIKYTINKLNNIVGEKVDVSVKKNRNPISYTLEFKKYTQFSDEIIKLGFILENKTEFLLFIQQLIGKEQKTFPMVFDYNVFIGGYNETNK